MFFFGCCTDCMNLDFVMMKTNRECLLYARYRTALMEEADNLAEIGGD